MEAICTMDKLRNDDNVDEVDCMHFRPLTAFFLHSLANVGFAVDFTKDGIDDGVVNTPSKRAHGRTSNCFLSPLKQSA